MLKRNRFVSIVLIAVMSILMFLTTATTGYALADSGRSDMRSVPFGYSKDAITVFDVHSVEAKPGETVKIDVSVNNDQGIYAGMLHMKYDAQVLTPGTPVIDNKNFMMLSSQKTGDISIIFAANPNIGSWPSSNNGLLFHVPFTVNSNAKSGEYTIALEADHKNPLSDMNARTIGAILGSAKVQVKDTTQTQPTSVRATSVSVATSNVTLNVGETYKIEPIFKPEGSVGEVTFQTNKLKVASVKSDGTIIAMGKGTATITMKFLGANARKQTRTKITVTVLDSPTNMATAKVKKVKVSPKKVKMGQYGSTVYVHVTIQPSQADQNFTVSSSNSSVAKAEINNGSIKVTSGSPGKAVITVSAANGKKAKVRVTVKK